MIIRAAKNIIVIWAAAKTLTRQHGWNMVNDQYKGKTPIVFLMSPSFSVAHKYEVPNQMSRSYNWNMAEGYHGIVDSTEAQ